MNVVKALEYSLRLKEKNIFQYAGVLHLASKFQGKQEGKELNKKDEKKIKKFWSLFEHYTVYGVSYLDQEIQEKKALLKQSQGKDELTMKRYAQCYYLDKAIQKGLGLNNSLICHREESCLRQDNQNVFEIISKEMYVNSYIFLVYPEIEKSNEEEKVKETYELLRYYTISIEKLKVLYHHVFHIEENLGNVLSCLLDWEHVETKEDLSKVYQEFIRVLDLKEIVPFSQGAPFALHHDPKITFHNMILHFLELPILLNQEFGIDFPKEAIQEICLQVIGQKHITRDIVQQMRSILQQYLQQIRAIILFLNGRRNFCIQEWNIALQKVIQSQFPDRKTKTLYETNCETKIYSTLKKIALSAKKLSELSDVSVQTLCFAIIRELRQEEFFEEQLLKIKDRLKSKSWQIGSSKNAYFQEKWVDRMQRVSKLKEYILQNAKEEVEEASAFEEYIKKYFESIVEKAMYEYL